MTSTNDSKSPAVKVKGVQVHATIERPLFDALEDHRWSVRLDMVSLVKLALTEYAERKGVLPAAAAPEAEAKTSKP